MRALAALGIPFSLYAKSSSEGVKDLDHDLRRESFAHLHTHALLEFGINDDANNSDWAMVARSKVQRWRAYWLQGLRVIDTVTPCAHLSSTDLFTSVGGQTMSPGYLAMLLQDQAWMRAGAPVDPGTMEPVAPGTPGSVPCPYLWKAWDKAAVAESSPGSNRFRTLPVVYEGPADASSAGEAIVPGYDLAPTRQYLAVLCLTGANAGQARLMYARDGAHKALVQAFPNPIAAGTTVRLQQIMTADGIHVGLEGQELFAADLAARLVEWGVKA